MCSIVSLLNFKIHDKKFVRLSKNIVIVVVGTATPATHVVIIVVDYSDISAITTTITPTTQATVCYRRTITRLVICFGD